MEVVTARQLSRALRPAWNHISIRLHETHGSDEVDGEVLAEHEPPREWLCPITGELMIEPMVTKCGHMFERSAITEWLKQVL